MVQFSHQLYNTFAYAFETDVFSISGRGTVATGRVERGTITKGSDIDIVGMGPTVKTTLTGIEMFHKELDRGEAGDNMGALLRGLKRDQIRRGQVLCAPGTVKSHKRFMAQLYILTKDEGGRHTPFVDNYRPQMFVRTTDVTVMLRHPAGTENPEDKMVMPGDNVQLECELMTDIALESGQRFTIREGGKTVGTGTWFFFSFPSFFHDVFRSLQHAHFTIYTQFFRCNHGNYRVKEL